MGLLEAGLMSEAAAGECAAVNASEKFEAEKFVEVLKVHRYGYLEENHIIQ